MRYIKNLLFIKVFVLLFISVNVEAQIDYALTVGTGITIPIQIPSGSTNTFPIAFDVSNVGTLEGNSESISLVVNSAFILSNVTVTGGGANPVWSCSPTVSDWNCFSSNTGNGMLPGATASVTGTITGYPTTAGLVNNVIDATVSVAGDNNALNDGKIIAVNIVAASPPDFGVSLIDIDGNAAITSLDFPGMNAATKVVHYRVVNSSTAGNAPSGSTLTLSYDPANFSLTANANNVLPPNWTCNPPVSGQVICTNNTTINSGATFDFFFDFTSVAGLAVGTVFATLDAMIADANNADPNAADNTAMTVVNIVATAVQTDLNLNKFTKDIIGGSIITNVIQDTQFVYAIQINNPSLTAATNIVVTDNIPPGIEITAASSLQGNWSCTVGAFIDNFTSQTVTCSLASLAASTVTSLDTIYLTAFGRASNASPITNTASITAINETDSNPVDNSGSSTITINPLTVPATDVFVTTTFDSGFFSGNFGMTVSQGADATFRILADSTLAPASNVVLTAVLPTGTSYVSHSVVGPNFVCAYDNINTVSCTATNLPNTTAQDGMLLTVKAVGVIGSSINFSASIVAGAGSNSDTGNDTSSPGAFLIVAPPYELDLTITKDAQFVAGNISNSSFLVGQSFEYKLIATNKNVNIAQPGDVKILDTLPTGIDLNALPSSFGWDCSATTGTFINCVNTVAIAANGGMLDLIIPVSSQLASTYSNTGSIIVSGVTSAFEVNTNDNASTFSVTLVNSISPTTLSVIKDALVAGSPVTSVNSSSNYTYRVNVGNTGNTNAVNIVVTDSMPVGIAVTSTSGIGWSCSNAGQLYTCTFPGPLTQGSNAFVDLNVTEGTAIGTMQIQNNVDVSADNATVISASNIIAVVRSDVTVNVIQNPDPTVENMPFDITIVVNNTGNSSLSGIQVDNTLPIGFSYGAIAKAASNCTVNGLLLSCSVLTPVAAGASVTIVVPIQAITTVASNAIYTNTTVVSGGNITIPITNTITFNITSSTVLPIDVSISKIASVTTVAPNSPFSYSLLVSNLGTVDVTGLTVVDNLPAGLQLLSISSTNWSCSGTSLVTCNQSTLLAGASSNIILNVQAPAQNGVISNTAQVSIVEQDGNLNNNISQSSVNVMTGTIVQPGVADLQLTKTTPSPTLVSGEQYSWDIEVLNKGPDTATNVLVNDVLPVGFQFNSVNTTDGTCQSSVSAVDCQIPSILNQDKVTITVMGVANINSGQLSSTATVMADTTDLVPENNADTAIVAVSPAPVLDTDLSVSIDVGNGINQGESSEFMIKVVNHGPDVALPPGLNVLVTGILESVTVNQGSDWTCQLQNFSVNCQFNGQQMLNGQQSFVAVTANTTRVVSDAQDLVVTAVVSTTGTDVDSNLANNTVTSILHVRGTPTKGDILNALRTVLAGTGNTQVNRAIESVASYCEIRFLTALEGMCESLYSSALAGNRDTINTFMEQITPNEVIGQSTSVSEIASAQFRNIGVRLSQLRGGGGGGFSAAGLNARYGNGSIPLGMLSYLNQTDAETDGIKQLKDDFITPWGFFVNGSVSMGKRDSTGRELGFDFDTYGLTAGFDYRLNAKKVIGIALGYANFGSNIVDTAKLNSTGLTLTGYGSFYVTDNFYVDARISYGTPKFDQSRGIDFTLGGIRVQRTAIGKTNSNQYSVAMSAGYSFYKNSWNITPNASFSYVKTNINSFTETGAGDFNFTYTEQQWDSLVWSAGLKLSKAISLKNGVITPQFDIDYNYQSKNNGGDIVARFINAPVDELFIIETDSPDRTYGSAGLGLVYISANGKQAYINYRSILGLEGFTRGTFNLGARFEF